VCMVNVRPKRESCVVNEQQNTIFSDMSEDFCLDIPSGAFDGEATVTLQVYNLLILPQISTSIL